MNYFDELSNPVLALPILLVGGAAVVWAAWNIRDLPVRVARSTPHPIATRDSVSRAYYAFLNGRYSDVLDRAAQRINRASERRFGRPVSELPSWRWRAERLAPGNGSKVLWLRRLNARVTASRAVAARREAGVWIRWDFWRSREEIQARFLRRIDPLLEEVSRLSRPRRSSA